MSQMKPTVYEGNYPYVFVSYAHADGAVMPIIRALVDEGYRVWYDDGIQMGSSFPDYIADHVFGCAAFLMFISSKLQRFPMVLRRGQLRAGPRQADTPDLSGER